MRALALSARLLAGASTFFFLSFIFAYFYLRSVNIDDMWRPAHVKPDQGLGAAFIACIVISAVMIQVANVKGRGDSRAWLAPAAGALLFGLLAVVFQCIEYTKQDFGPTNGAYASVFIAWTGFYLIAVLATMYWLEIQVATEVRSRRESLPEDYGKGTYEHPDLLLPRGLDAAAFFWTYLACLGVVTYVTLYLV